MTKTIQHQTKFTTQLHKKHNRANRPAAARAASAARQRQADQQAFTGQTTLPRYRLGTTTSSRWASAGYYTNDEKRHALRYILATRHINHKFGSRRHLFGCLSASARRTSKVDDVILSHRSTYHVRASSKPLGC